MAAAAPSLHDLSNNMSQLSLDAEDATAASGALVGPGMGSKKVLCITFQSLPDVPLGVVGTFLCLQDLFAFSQACRKTNTVFNSGSMYVGNTAFVELVVRGLRRSDNMEAFQRKYPRFATQRAHPQVLPSITFLDLTFGKRDGGNNRLERPEWRFSTMKIQEIRDLFPRVVHLKAWLLPSEWLTVLAKDQLALQRLSLETFVGSDRSFIDSIVQLPALKQLDRKLTNPFIKAIVESHLKDQLVELSASFLASVEALSSLTCMTKLQRLNIDNNSHLTNEVLDTLCASSLSTQLVQFNLNSCGFVGAQSLRKIATMTLLESLNLRGTQTDDSVVEAIVKSPLRDRLQELDVSYCLSISPEALKKLGALTALTSLNLKKTKTNSDVLDALASSSLRERLRKLDVGLCENISNNGWRGLVDFVLQELGLKGIAFNGLLYFLFYSTPMRRTLIKLDLEGCHNISFDSFQTAVQLEKLSEIRTSILWNEEEMRLLKKHAFNENLRFV